MLRTIFLFVLLLSTNHAFGQDDWIDTSKHEGLKTIPTDYPFSVYSTNNSVQDATDTLNTLHQAHRYFNELFSIDLPFSVMLLDNRNWSRFAFYPPPGMPQAWQGNIILGAEKSAIAHQVSQALSQLPASQLTQLTQVYGSPLNLDLFYRDTLSVHELAHLYHFYSGTKPQRKSLQELFATLAMVAFFKQADCTSCYERMNAYPQFILRGGDRDIEFKTLADFEEKYLNGLGPRNYEWFQMHFYQHAVQLLESENKTLLIKFRHFLLETDLSKIERMSDNELIEALRQNIGSDVADIFEHWQSPKQTDV
ncbi:hypothetical protein [Alteromonas ponticola]|uniref:DUF1570 domain-containing protein n=1 Tax=Alteromonas ponticola TaxID=2720613 RepID=A0ABX1QYB7_9ALTE|nr:hypothetical protein [Alteromonas ponticola]NMH58493.1 hypothetical protein [Alteromonas ponticola]